ncbi:MAG: hypothetical protein ACE5KP_06030 [Dehalococcoidales bacterium]
MIDGLGFFAGACLIASMLLRNIYAVKILLAVAAISFLVYGIILHLLPIIVINSVLTATGIYEMIRLTRKRKEAASTG